MFGGTKTITFTVQLTAPSKAKFDRACELIEHRMFESLAHRQSEVREFRGPVLAKIIRVERASL